MNYNFIPPQEKFEKEVHIVKGSNTDRWSSGLFDVYQEKM